MIAVGVDSYVTVEDADRYINEWYLSADPQRQAWEGMQEPEKEICLRRACGELERLAYNGVKFAFVQPLSFPRYFGISYEMINGVLYSPEVDRYPELKEVPQDVRAAQIEEALEIASPTEATEARKTRNSAVKSYSIGHLSETFELANGIIAILASVKAQELVRQYTGGGFDVR